LLVVVLEEREGPHVLPCVTSYTPVLAPGMVVAIGDCTSAGPHHYSEGKCPIRRGIPSCKDSTNYERYS